VLASQRDRLSESRQQRLLVEPGCGRLPHDPAQRRYRRHRNQCAHHRHQVFAETVEPGKALRAVEGWPVDVVMPQPVAKRQGSAKIGAGVAEGAALQQDFRKRAQAEPDARPDHEASAPGPEFGRAGAHHVGILRHAIVVGADRNDDDVRRGGRIEIFGDEAEQAEAGLLQPAIRRQRALGKYRMRHPRRGRHLYIALERTAIQRIVRIAPDEITAGAAHQLADRENARPFADAEGQHGALRRQVGHQQVIHVGAVIRHEDNAVFVADRLQRRLVGEPDRDPVEPAQHAASEAVADAKIKIRVECGHDFERDPVQPVTHILEGHALFLGDLGRRAEQLRVGCQLVREGPVTGQREGRQFEL